MIPRRFWGVLCSAAVTLAVMGERAVASQITVFMQAVAETAASDRDIAAFYRANAYQPIWITDTPEAAARRAALMRAIADAPAHGLPSTRYDWGQMAARLRDVKTERELGVLEVDMSRLFLSYAQDVQTGILTPREIDPGLVREVLRRDRVEMLTQFKQSSPQKYIKLLAPQTPEYARLMKEKIRFERLVAKGGWGAQVRAKSLKLGQTGDAVVQLRNRLIAMGYLPRTSLATYDTRMLQAVAAFQRDNGLVSDGDAGQTTLDVINVSAQERLSQIIVAMERERWLNRPLGQRHIWVNITDFHARIIDDGKVTFQTRSVVGHRDADRRTPEFSDVMEHMVINPTWHVPRSIATKEYLPLLQRNPMAVGHLRITDRRGRVVNRAEMDFTQFSRGNFPFDMKQPPSQRNALGLVKFMFPNRHNIYLHDTPQKALFGRQVRAFSHGCIRLNDPFDFAYALLAVQSEDPKALFQKHLSTGRETQVDLENHVPVHLVYRTAFTQAKGRVQFRRDVYGRDGKIWRALADAGVSLPALQG